MEVLSNGAEQEACRFHSQEQNTSHFDPLLSNALLGQWKSSAVFVESAIANIILLSK